MKSRLRHPVRAVREPFGTAGLIVAVIALVAALAGGAVAATGGSDNGHATASAKKKAKAKPGPRGPKGAAGATGPAGPAGPKGDKGDPGAAGANGSNGTNGTDGAAGKSVVLVNSAPPNCEEGGFTYEVQGSGQAQEICNGEEGEEGPKGSPWSATGNLPPGASETGLWSFRGGVEKVTVVTETEPTATQELTIGDETAAAPVSFTLPLGAQLENGGGLEDPGNHVHFATEANFKDFDGEAGPEKLGCKGSQANPLAPPGHLCIYKSGALSNATVSGLCKPGCGTEGAGRTGAVVSFTVTGMPAFGMGSWVVKAPCASGEEIVEVPDSPVAELTEFNCQEASS